MPLTIAHPAAAILVHSVLRQWSIPSALVIGSIAPDLPYFLPLGFERVQSHSLAALVWFCVPAGCVAYVIFHVVMKRPLLSLLWPELRARLDSLTGDPHRVPSASWLAVLVSLLVGAATHVLWDGFTHADAAAVRQLEFLRAPLFHLGPYPVPAYQVLQHASTVVGVLFLCWWLRRWLRDAPPGSMNVGELTSSARFVAGAALLTIPVAWGLAVALSYLSEPISAMSVRTATGRGVVSSFSAFGAALLVYSAGWHLWSRRAR